MKIRQKSDFLSSRVRYLDATAILPNPHQPRRHFDEAALRELSESIRTYGILQPLTVRKTERGYELVAGERRLRAAQLAGERQVPCLIAQVGEEDSALLALIENLQRRDLDYWEEAEAIARLITTYRLTQEQAAEKLGRSQSAVANKLRLLRLGEEVRRLLRENGLSERHARALLRLEGEEQRLAAAGEIIHRGYNVEKSEQYIDSLLATRSAAPKPRSTYILKDVRLFLNSVERGLTLMRRGGVEAQIGRRDTEEEIFLTIRIPKRGAPLGKKA